MLPRFSVIITTHNRPKLLRRAVASVVAQTYPHWELLIVDDASTTDTQTALHDYLTDDRTHYYPVAFRNVSHSRNFGTLRASGTYCCYLDDDDAYLKNHLQQFADAATGHPKNALLRSGMWMQYPDQRIAVPNYSNQADSLLEYWKLPTNILTLAVPRPLAVSTPFHPDILSVEDFWWATELLLQVPFRQLPEYTTVYYQHTALRSPALLDEELFNSIITVMEGAYAIPAFARRVPHSVFTRQIVHRYTHTARQLLRAGNRSGARALVRKAVSRAGVRDVPDLAKTYLKTWF